MSFNKNLPLKALMDVTLRHCINTLERHPVIKVNGQPTPKGKARKETDTSGEGRVFKEKGLPNL